MKKLVSMMLVLCMALTLIAGAALAEGGKQTASATLDRDSEPVVATVDLTGGWSVEFASGAFYLYEGEITKDRDADAIGLTLEKDVYEDYMAEATASDSCREVEGGVCYETEDETDYVLAVGSDAYFLVAVPAGTDGDAILSRIDLKSEKEYFDEAMGVTFEGEYYTFEGSGVAMKLPADFEDAFDEPIPGIFYSAGNAEVALQVQPVDGDFADPDELMEYYNTQEYVVRATQLSFNGVDLVYVEGGDDDVMVYALVSAEGTGYAFVFMPLTEDGTDAILQIVSTICPSDSIPE